MPIQIIQISIAVIVLFTIIYLMIKKKSSASVSLLWIAISMGIIIFAIWPNLLNMVSALLKVDYPPILAVALAIMALIGMVFYLSTEVAVQQTKIRELSIHISLLNHEVHKLKNGHLPASDKE